MAADAADAELPDHVRRNRVHWDGRAEEYAKGPAGERAWSAQAHWGVWSIPESELGLLDDVAGKDVIEPGCGTAYVCAWLARRGARPVGIDNSAGQLATARRMQREHGLQFPLIHGNAESVPLPDASFDLAISEYGAAIWCDPYAWIPEAARLLRPGGRLIFLGNSSLLMVCVPDLEEEAASETMLRPWFGMHRFEWPDEDLVEFHLGHGDWIRLLRANGFEVQDLLELRPSDTASTGYPFVTLDWARRWPSEEVWKARKRA